MLLHQHTSKKGCILIVLSQILINIVIGELDDKANDIFNGKGIDNDDNDPTAIGVSTAEDCTDDYQIKTLKLVLSWGPGICSTKVQCKNPATDFTIHGFWPKFYDTTDDIRCCTQERYDKTITNPLRQAMHNWWPAMNNNMNSEDFWSYQWGKHGREFQIKNALIEDGFEPDDEETYLGSDMVESLLDTYGVEVELNCARLNSNSEIRTLTEVSICFDEDLQPTDCPDSKSRCLKRILFPRSVL